MYSNYLLTGWADEMEERALVMFKLEAGKEVTFSLKIFEDFSWTTSYRKRSVNQEFCSLLKDVPYKINTGIFLNTER